MPEELIGAFLRSKQRFAGLFFFSPDGTPLLVMLFFSLLAIYTCYTRYFNIKRRCYICHCDVPEESWDEHRVSGCQQRDKLLLLETSLHGRCGKCRGQLKLLKRYWLNMPAIIILDMVDFPILHVAEMWKRGHNNLIQVALVFIPFKVGK